MKIHYLFISFFLLVKTVDLQLSKPLNTSLKSNQTATYNFDIDPTNHQNTNNIYIVAKSQSENITLTPQIRVYNLNKNWNCQQIKNEQLCILGINEVDETNKFFIQIKCINECNYTLEAYVSQQYNISLYQQIIFKTFTKKPLFFSLQIPKQLNFTQISITAEIINIQQLNSNIIMRGNINDSSKLDSEATSLYIGKTIWNDGLGIFLSKKDISNGDIIKFVIQGNSNTKIHLKSLSSYNNITTIRLGDKIKDYIQQKTKKYYKINISSVMNISNTTIQINTASYTGQYKIIVSNQYNTNITFNCDKYTQYGIKRFIFKPEEIQQYFSQNSQIIVQIQGIIDSTFQIKSSSYGQSNFIMISDNQIQFSKLKFQQVDNFLLIKTYSIYDTQNTIIQLKVSLTQFLGMSRLVIKRCQSLQVNNTLECVINNITSIQDKKQQMLPTYNHFLGKIKQYTLFYNYTKCPIQNFQYKCVFQLIAWSSFKKQNLEYSIKMEDQNRDVVLKQNLAHKFRVQINQFKYFTFTLGSVYSVKQIKFYLNTVSGDCVLIASNTTYHPQLFNTSYSNQHVVFSGNLNFKKQDSNFSSKYYLSVYGYEYSHFMINVQVIRENIIKTPIELTQNMYYTFNIQSGQNQKSFYIKLVNPKDFFIAVTNHDSYSLAIKVYPSLGNHIESKQPWQHWQTKNDIIQITNINQTYTANNQFIVIIECKQNRTTKFSITFSTNGFCVYYRVGETIQISILKQMMRCLQFTINKLANFQIMITKNFFQNFKDISIFYFINGMQMFQKSPNILFMQKSLLQKQFCPYLKYSTDATVNVYDCRLKVVIKSQQNLKINVLAQFVGSQLQLLDGVKQYIYQRLPNHSAKLFYMRIKTNKTINIVLKRTGTQSYIIKAKLLSQNDFAQLSTEEAYDNFVYQSQTDATGISSLIIREEQIKKINYGQKFLVLISVSLSLNLDIEANFTISISQQIQQLKVGDSKLDFIEKDQKSEFIFRARQDSIIILSCIVSNCIKQLKIFQQNEIGQYVSVVTKNNQVILKGNLDNPILYLLEIQGRFSSNYYIISNLIGFEFIELIEGVFYDHKIALNQSLYYLYYSHQDQPITVLALEDYGQVQLYAAYLNQTKQSIQNKFKNIQFEVKSQSYKGSLEIQTPISKSYYVIKVNSSQSAKFTLLVKSGHNSIPIRDDRIIRGKLQKSSTITYAFKSQLSFRLQITHIYGEFNIIVQNNQRVFDKIKDNNIYYFQIKQSGKSIQSPQSNYIISIIGFRSSAYIMTIKLQQNFIKLKYNNPVPYLLKRNKQVCGYFISEQKPSEMFIIMQTGDTITTNLQYSFTCQPYGDSNDTCNISNIKTTKNNKNINIQFQPNEGLNEYHLCAKSKSTNMYLSILVSTNNVMELAPVSQFMFQTTKSNQISYFQIYNNLNNAFLFLQIYECTGKVNVSSSSSLKALRGQQQDLIISQVQIFGHKMITVDNLTQGQYFLRAQTQQGNNYLLKYSFFHESNPYEQFTLNSSQINIQLVEDSIIFSFHKVNASDSLDILSINYILAISNDKDLLMTYSQCNIQGDKIFKRILKYYKQYSNISQIIDHQVKINHLNIFFTNQKELFVQVIAQIQYVPNNFYKSDYYKIAYTMSHLLAPKQSKLFHKNNSLWYYVLWIVFPIAVGIILIVFSVVFCIKRIYRLKYTKFQDEPNLKSTDVINIETANQSQKVMSMQFSKKSEV